MEPITSSTCFHCKNQGHWIRDCPYIYKTPPSPDKNILAVDFPEIECHNCHRPCTAKVSRTSKNPGRIYYACPATKCRFFKWYDQLKDAASGPPPTRSEYPMCSCGPGLCRLLLNTSQPNPNAPRFYFVCPITKGHGACPFFLWYDTQPITASNAHVDESRHDTSPKSSLTGHQAVDTVNYDLDEIDELNLEHPSRFTFKSAEIDNPQHPLPFDTAPFVPSENEEETQIGILEEHNDTLNMELSTNFSNLQVVLRDHFHDPVLQEGCLLNPMMEKAPQVLQQTYMQAEIHRQQIEFRRQSSAARDTLTGGKDLTQQFLEFPILGWLGRLAFPPSRCLTVPPSKPLFCCVFPSLDPISIPKETYESHSEVMIDLPHSPSNSDSHSSPQNFNHDDAQPLSGVLFELSGLKNLLGPSQGSVVAGTIAEALEQAALPIQNLLLTLLESMDPLKHESMAWAAESTFAALDHLSVDYKPFSDRVRKYIGCASSLAELEQLIDNDLSSQELIKWYHNEVNRLNDVSLTHADMVNALTTSDHHLQLLRKEVSRVRKMLLQIENQLSLCEAERSKLKTRVSETSKDMLECEKRLQAAAQKAEAAMELCHQREVKRSAAKAAFEEARVRLRQ